MAARQVDLSIESRLENVASVGETVNRLCRESGFSEGDAYNVELAVVEAVSNCVRHAYRGEPGHRVDVRLRLEGDRIEVRILDDGLPVPEASLGLASGDAVTVKTEHGEMTAVVALRDAVPAGVAFVSADSRLDEGDDAVRATLGRAVASTGAHAVEVTK